MNILYHHRTMVEDAQGIHIAEMIRAFELNGHHVELFSLVKRGGREQKGEVSLLGRLKSAMPEMIFELAEISYNLFAIFALLLKIMRARPDFIYERYALYNAAGVVVSRLTGIPVVLEVNAPLAFEKRQYGHLSFPRLAAWFEKFICSSATYTLTVTTPLKNILIAEGVRPEKVIVMPNGIRKELLLESPNNPALKESLGIPRDAIVLGFVGWFRPWHGLDRLIDLFYAQQLAQQGACLLLVGGGPILAQLQAQAERLGLSGRSVFFTGPLPHDSVYQHIKVFDLALQPNVTSYASPMKIFEYLGLGKPVLAPRFENIEEILTDGYNSWLCDINEEVQFAGMIKNALSSAEEIRARSAHARETVVGRDYFWEGNAARTVKLVEKQRHKGGGKCVA